MKVKECMSTDVELGNPQMPICDAAQKMRDGDFGVMPIGDNDRIVGMVTDRDLVIRAVAECKDPRQTTLQEIMSPGTLYCFEDQTVEEVARNMGENQVRRLPVLNRDKRLVGMISLGDLALSDEDRDEVEVALSKISRHQIPMHEQRM